MPSTSNPRRLRADLALHPPPSDTPIVIRRPGWSAAIGQPMPVPAAVRRPRPEETVGVAVSSDAAGGQAPGSDTTGAQGPDSGPLGSAETGSAETGSADSITVVTGPDVSLSTSTSGDEVSVVRMEEPPHNGDPMGINATGDIDITPDPPSIDAVPQPLGGPVDAESGVDIGVSAGPLTSLDIRAPAVIDIAGVIPAQCEPGDDLLVLSPVEDQPRMTGDVVGYIPSQRTPDAGPATASPEEYPAPTEAVVEESRPEDLPYPDAGREPEGLLPYGEAPSGLDGLHPDLAYDDHLYRDLAYQTLTDDAPASVADATATAGLDDADLDSHQAWGAHRYEAGSYDADLHHAHLPRADLYDESGDDELSDMNRTDERVHGADPPGGRHRQPRRAPRRSQRTIITVALVAAALLALGIGALLWRGDQLRSTFGTGSGDGGPSGDAPAAARERQSVTGTMQPIQDLTVGSCFQDLPEGPGPYSGVEVVDCAGSHDNQLVAVFELADREWPGDLVIADEAQARCRDIGRNVVERAGAEPAAWDFWVLVPTRQGWVLNDDRVVQCMTYDPAGPVEGDVLS